jgi:hypothetical protein
MLNWLELTAILNRPIAFHRVFAEIGGGAIPGLFLSQAFYWTSRTKDPDGWFYKTQEEWCDETALIRSEQDRARRELKSRKLIEEQKRGLPCKLYYRVNKTALLESITSFMCSKQPDSQFAESTKLDCNSQQTRVANPANKSGQSCKQCCNFQQTGLQDSTDNLYPETTSETTSEITSETTSPLVPHRENGERESAIAVNAEVVEEESAQLPSLATQANHASNQEADFPGKTKPPGRRDNNTRLQWLLQEYDSGRITTLPKDELVLLAGEVIGDCVGLYRRSGQILASSRNDIDKSFLRFAADKHCRGDLQNADGMITNWEKTPEFWRKLVGLVEAWQETFSKPEILNEKGEQVTGATAECVQALANDEMLQLFMSVKTDAI